MSDGIDGVDDVQEDVDGDHDGNVIHNKGGHDNYNKNSSDIDNCDHKDYKDKDTNTNNYTTTTTTIDDSISDSVTENFDNIMNKQ